MSKWLGTAAIAATSVLLATSVPAQVTDPTKLEQKCEMTVGSTLSKFVGSKSKCISKCFTTARKTSGPYTGCFPPYTDTTTNTCITGSLKGAEAKTKAAIVKACTVAVPGCYTGGATGAANTFVNSSEAKIDQQTPSIACGSPSGAFVE